MLAPELDRAPAYFQVRMPGKQMSETQQLPIVIPKEELAQFCQRHHIRKLSLLDISKK